MLSELLGDPNQKAKGLDQHLWPCGETGEITLFFATLDF
jgi:hypothetical protein